MTLKLKTLMAAAAVAWAGLTGQASAQAYTCDTLGAFTLFPIDSPIGASGPMGGSGVAVQLEVGDVVSVTLNGGFPPPTDQARAIPASMSMNSAGYVITVTAPGRKYTTPLPVSYTAVEAGTHFFGDLRFPRDMDRQSEIQDGMVPVYFTTATVTCSPAGGSDALGTVSAFNQASTILRGLGSLRGAPDGGSVQLSKDFAFGAQGDAATGWRVWGYADLRRFSEDATGQSFGATFGADRDLGNLRAGVLMSYDTTTLDLGGGDERVTSLAVGPYVAGDAGPLSYDAFVTLSRPQYELIGGDETGKRVTYGLRGATAFETSIGTVSPFLSVTGAHEEVGGDTLNSVYQAAGVRVDFAAQMGFDPYLSLAYTNNRIQSALTGTTEHQSMRYGLGFTHALENGATLGVDLDAGEAIEGIRDVGLRLSYTMEF